MPKRAKAQPQPGSNIKAASKLVGSLLDCFGFAAATVQDVAKRRGIEQPADCPAALAILGALRSCVRLYAFLARNGNPALCAELPFYAEELVEALSDVSEKYPHFLAETANHRISWPIMAARHYPKESDFKALADRIGLGTKTLVNCSARARYKLTTPMNQFILTLLAGTIFTDKEFYWVTLPRDMPKLTAKTLDDYLDHHIMPMLDQIREKEGSWDGIPVIANIVKRIPYESEHRSAVRNRIKRALRAMSIQER